MNKDTSPKKDDVVKITNLEDREIKHLEILAKQGLSDLNEFAGFIIKEYLNNKFTSVDIPSVGDETTKQ